jgi:hypothetical protein
MIEVILLSTALTSFTVGATVISSEPPPGYTEVVETDEDGNTTITLEY